MKNNYLLEGTDYLTISKKIDEIITRASFNDAPVSNYDLEEVSLDDVIEDLDTYGFLSSKKVIIAKNFSSLNLDENKDKIDHLFKYLDNFNPDNLFFITDKKLDDRKKITKDLKKKMESLKVSLNPNDFVKQELKNYKLEPGVVNLMIEYSGEDISKLYNDCLKLKELRYETLEISKSDVCELCLKKPGDTTAMSFEFIKLIAKKDKKNALNMYKELMNSGVDAISMIGLIASQIRIMYQVKLLKKDRLSDKEISDILGEKSSYRITKTNELINYYTDSELLLMMQRLSDIDLKIKTDGVDANFLIELLIINI